MKRTPLYLIGKNVALAFFKLFMPYRIHNIEKVPKSGRMIICSNHQSFKDPVLLTALVPKRQIYYMAKAELFKNKLLGTFFRGAGVFSVQRGKGDATAINTAAELLQKEEILGIFIEGTRSKDGEFLQPKSGAVLLAYQNNAPILPVCITGSKSLFPKLFHKVDVVCGDPIYPSQLGIEKGSGTEYRQASRKVMANIAALRESGSGVKALGGESKE